MSIRSNHPEVFLRKGVLKICNKFTTEHPCWSLVSIKLQRNFIEIALRHGCSPVNLLHIFGTPFPRNTSGWLLLPFFIYHFLFRFIYKQLINVFHNLEGKIFDIFVSTFRYLMLLLLKSISCMNTCIVVSIKSVCGIIFFELYAMI